MITTPRPPNHNESEFTMARRNSTYPTTSESVSEDAASALLVQLHACRRLLELARSGAAFVLHRHGLMYSNKTQRALADIVAAEYGISEAAKTVERLMHSPGKVSDVLQMAGLTSTSAAV